MKMWEAVTLLVAAKDREECAHPEELLTAAMADESIQWHGCDLQRELDSVYRRVGEAKTDIPYPVLLAQELGLEPPSGSLKIKFSRSFYVPVAQNAIVLAPFGPTSGLEIPMVVWRHVARFMRSYGRPVLFLGDKSSRLDIACFSEGELLGRYNFDAIMATIKAAEIVIGIPNEWTWLAASLNKKCALLYPDNMPPMRWWWYVGNIFGRALFSPTQVQTPVILTALRKLLEVL